MLQIKTEAVVLEKKAGYGDEGYVFLFTQEFGITRATASGLLKSSSRLAAWTEPPSLITADFLVRKDGHSGKRLLTLSPKNFFPRVKSCYANLNWCFGYAQILSHFLPSNIPLPKLYPIWKEILSHQKSWEDGRGRNLNFAYLVTKLLKHEGVLPEWRHCFSCEKPWQKEEPSYFVFGREGLVCRECFSKTSPAGQNSLPLPNVVLDFLNIFSQEKELVLPKSVLRVPEEIRIILEICDKSAKITELFARVKSQNIINDQSFLKLKNFLLIFLISLL
ncbi:MAG: DNA repair protein RecO [Candidatus Moranbacteria bacterium]|nr:DNA repair protein RecO [Candidatus Moranbacteria bacterium]